jgi:phosphoribosylanthranilate isomerase
MSELVFVKICGITTEEDALLAVALGADAVGFVFAPSKRQVTPTRVRDIVKRLPSEMLTVGVFRDAEPSRVIETVNAAGLKAAQLHGHETPEQAREVRAGVGLLIQAFAAGSKAIQRLEEYGADAVLMDGSVPGSGELFDWRLLDGMNRGQRVILAGGLDPHNVGAAISQVGPWGVDVSSGVERSPGHKDPVKMRAFIRAAKEAKPPPESEPPGPPGERRRPDLYDWQDEL